MINSNLLVNSVMHLKRMCGTDKAQNPDVSTGEWQLAVLLILDLGKYMDHGAVF